ncbi:hypothetical protein FNV43_RR19352 [Rhamnella rubrinervis]|uniref:Protein kinase domain-containing protein n=1 Tax=Rhamnella rubrinervis TaxID=2594499 RepID=A0A8K0E2H4_9ROSA|nr:hypothetical protein FNV43_RR19352 [Rhamnella rubrinervis]
MALAAPGQLNVEEIPSWGSRSVDCFEKLEQIGEGTYGQVFMARETKSGEIVALKRYEWTMKRRGMLLFMHHVLRLMTNINFSAFMQFPITAIREIKILKKLQHENIVKLKEIVTSTGPENDEQKNQDGNKFKGGVYMVFEYMDHDLTGLADRPGLRFTIPQIKCYMKQLLTGLHYCHINHVLHRDIKGSNLLIDNEGKLKLADFGLARSFSSDHGGNLTNRVITLWYRPPELLLGATMYGPAVDMWSVGCIFAELLHGKPILTGKSEPEQLNKIFELCGSPDENNWPNVSETPWYNNFRPTRSMRRRVRETFWNFDRHALDLLDHLLTLDPKQRWTAKEALDADYFWTDPLPCDPKSLPKYESSHEFQTKKNGSSSDKMKNKLQRDRNYNILSSIPACLPFSILGELLHSGMDLIFPKQCTSCRPSRYPASGNQSGGFNSNRGAQVGGYSANQYPPQGRGPPYAGTGMPVPGPRGVPSGYGVGPPNYSQSNQYGGSTASRGPNSMGSNRNQYGGWQQQ